jgi:hypothetical protein
MARTKQLARKYTGGDAPQYAKKAKEAREAINYTWIYIMVRFIDIRCRMKMNVEGHFDAETMLDLCREPDDIYQVFGLENETNARLHVVTGVQARRYQDDTLDAYLLVGFRVREGQDDKIEANEVMVQNINKHFIYECVSSPLKPEHITIIYDDDHECVELCESIIKDMEDTDYNGFIDDVAY